VKLSTQKVQGSLISELKAKPTAQDDFKIAERIMMFFCPNLCMRHTTTGEKKAKVIISALRTIPCIFMPN